MCIFVLCHRCNCFHSSTILLYELCHSLFNTQPASYSPVCLSFVLSLTVSPAFSSFPSIYIKCVALWFEYAMNNYSVKLCSGVEYARIILLNRLFKDVIDYDLQFLHVKSFYYNMNKKLFSSSQQNQFLTILCANNFLTFDTIVSLP